MDKHREEGGKGASSISPAAKDGGVGEGGKEERQTEEVLWGEDFVNCLSVSFLWGRGGGGVCVRAYVSLRARSSKNECVVVCVYG